jgi:uncharacterized protein YndB with AHSA1/START domain
MATTTRDIPASPERVWAVLADPRSYAEWVVGAARIRGFDGSWPARGARFHHSVGVWPLHIRDTTSVLESDPPRRLVLRARARPLGHARIEFTLTASELGTRLVMTEEVTSPLASRAKRLLDPLIHSRNTEGLRRLESLACQVAT